MKKILLMGLLSIMFSNLSLMGVSITIAETTGESKIKIYIKEEQAPQSSYTYKGIVQKNKSKTISYDLGTQTGYTLKLILSPSKKEITSLTITKTDNTEDKTFYVLRTTENKDDYTIKDNITGTGKKADGYWYYLSDILPPVQITIINNLDVEERWKFTIASGSFLKFTEVKKTGAAEIESKKIYLPKGSSATVTIKADKIQNDEYIVQVVATTLRTSGTTQSVGSKINLSATVKNDTSDKTFKIVRKYGGPKTYKKTINDIKYTGEKAADKYQYYLTE